MTKAKQPVVITVLDAKADLLRQIAVRLNLSYKEVAGQEDAIKFVFQPLNEEQTRNLVDAIPREVYVYQGMIR